MIDIEKTEKEELKERRKERNNYLRSTSIPFISVLGGIILVLFLHEVAQIHNDPKETLYSVHVVYIGATMLLFLRYYWLYLNTFTFLAPFDSIWLLSVDILGTFTGGITVSNINTISLWFLSLGICMVFALLRIIMTIKIMQDKQNREKTFTDIDFETGSKCLHIMLIMTIILCTMSFLFAFLNYNYSTVEVFGNIIPADWALGVITLIASIVIFFSYQDGHYPLLDEK